MASEREVVSRRRGFGENWPPKAGVGRASWGAAGAPRERRSMELHRVEAIGIGKARKDLYDLLRQVEAGVHFLLLRFDKPVAAVISHGDYVAFSELARRDALTRALLQGKGYDPESLTPERFLELLADHVKEEK